MTTIQLISTISGIVSIAVVVGGAIAAIRKVPEITRRLEAHAEKLENVVHYEDLYSNGKNVYVRCADCLSCRSQCFAEREKVMNGFELTHKEVKNSIRHLNDRMDSQDKKLDAQNHQMLLQEQKREQATRVHMAVYKALSEKFGLKINFTALLNGQ